MKKNIKLDRLNILLVDDNEHDRVAFQRAFRGVEMECAITECAGAPEVFSLLENPSNTFDCIVVDHFLPCLQGVDLCKDLLAASVQLPMVILTGFGSEQVAAEALKAGVDDYIIKDSDSAYLQMMPMVIIEVVVAHRERLAAAEAERSLLESRERLSGILEGLTIPTFVIDINHVTTHWNHACEKITGVPASEIIGTKQQWRAFYPSDRPVLADLIVDEVGEDLIAKHYSEKYQCSQVIDGALEAEDFFPHFGEEGKWIFFTAAPLKGADGRIIGAIETLQDVTERRKAEIALKESELRHRELSITDGLTGLYNSRHFYSRAKEEAERSRRYSTSFSLILMDVDNFKQFNDTYGHLEGDRVLALLAEVIRREIRGVDSAFRYGGEEFVVIFPETEPAEARVVAERLRKAFAGTRFNPEPGEEVRMTISIGGGRFHHEEELISFIKRVDQAMYMAKRSGKNRVLFAGMDGTEQREPDIWLEI